MIFGDLVHSHSGTGSLRELLGLISFQYLADIYENLFYINAELYDLGIDSVQISYVFIVYISLLNGVQLVGRKLRLGNCEPQVATPIRLLNYAMVGWAVVPWFGIVVRPWEIKHNEDHGKIRDFLKESDSGRIIFF